MKSYNYVYAVLLLAMASPLPSGSFAHDDLISNPAIESVSRDSKMDRYRQQQERIHQGNVDLLMIGDSITQHWEDVGSAVWNEYYGDRNTANFGISGDRTENVIWRLRNTDFSAISPKLAVLMIGTNNTNADHSHMQTSEGVELVIEDIQAQLPDTKILLLGIFPRGNTPTHYLNVVNMKVNSRIAKLADEESIFYLDIGDVFLDENGYVQPEIMPDLLHLSEEGYYLWAQATEPAIQELMQ